MRTYPWILVIAIAVGCAGEAKESKTDRFFIDWLEGHGETNVVVDRDGVGLADNATRLKASLYGSEEQEDGSYVVETEFRMRLPSGDEIVEYVAGIGETEDQAIDDCLLNFTLSTFHVVYKSFMNPDDPHQTVERVAINGETRQIIMGDIFMRGSESDEPIDLQTLRPQIQAAIVSLPLSKQPHWIKIVYGQVDGDPMTVSAALDNEEHQSLTAAIEGLSWPIHDGFYMVKQFIVVK